MSGQIIEGASLDPKIGEICIAAFKAVKEDPTYGFAYMSHPLTNGDSLTKDNIERNRDLSSIFKSFLKKQGITNIINPCDFYVPSFSTKQYMDFWLNHVIPICEYIYLAPGWEKSKGCRIEVTKAVELNKLIFTFCRKDTSLRIADNTKLQEAIDENNN